jgi:hypothetical protein
MYKQPTYNFQCIRVMGAGPIQIIKIVIVIIFTINYLNNIQNSIVILGTKSTFLPYNK